MTGDSELDENDKPLPPPLSPVAPGPSNVYPAGYLLQAVVNG